MTIDNNHAHKLMEAWFETVIGKDQKNTCPYGYFPNMFSF